MTTKKSIPIKVVLLGSNAIGQTYLLDRFINNRYRTKPWEPTIGAGYKSKNLTINERQVNLCIWDLAGNERFDETSRMVYRGAHVAILCFDLRDQSSFDRVRFWFEDLQKHEQNDVKIYLCATKCDLIEGHPEKRVISEDMVRSLAVDCEADFFETSSKTGENVEELFTQVAKDYVQKMAEKGLKTGFRAQCTCI